MDLNLYKKLAGQNGEKLHVVDTETGKHIMVSREDYDTDRNSGKNKYTFADDQALFATADGQLFKDDASKFTNYYDDPNYTYVDKDYVPAVTKDEDQLRTGEKFRDWVTDRFGTGALQTSVSNFWDAVSNGLTFGGADLASGQTRVQELQEQRQREEAGFIGGVGTVAGEIGGIIGATVETGFIGGLGGAALAGARVAKYAPIVAKLAKNTATYLKSGKGIIHTGAVGAAYSVPYAITAAATQKDAVKGAETIAYGSLIPMGLHVVGKGFGAPAGWVAGKSYNWLRNKFTKVPTVPSKFAAHKEKLANAISGSGDDVVPDSVYLKMAEKNKKIELPDGVLTPQIKRNLIREGDRADILDVQSSYLKYVNRMSKGKSEIPSNKDLAFKQVSNLQKSIDKDAEEIGKQSARHFFASKKEVSDILKRYKKDLKGDFMNQSDEKVLKNIDSYLKQLQAKVGKRRKTTDKVSLKELSSLKSKYANPKTRAEIGIADDLAKLQDDVISRGGVDLAARSKSPMSPHLIKLTQKYKQKQAQKLAGKTILESLDADPAVSQLPYKLDPQNIVTYGVIGTAGFGASGVPGIAAAAVIATAASKALSKGTMVKYADRLKTNIDSINNIGSYLLKGDKKVSGLKVTATTISRILLGRETEDQNALAVGLSSSLNSPANAAPDTARAVNDSIYSSLGINTPERKLAAAEAYNRLEAVVLKNIQFIDKNDPMKEEKKQEFLDNVGILFSPAELLDKVRTNSLTPQMVSNYREAYPRLYAEMVNNILQENSRRPIMEQYGFERAQMLSMLIGQDLTGLSNYPQPQPEAPPEREKNAASANRFKGVPASLRKAIFSPKSPLRTAETFGA